jgi:hypothetical protein
MHVQDYTDLMTRVPEKQCQMRNMGKRLPTSMLLTSWSHVPFGDLKVWSNPKHTHETALTQPIIGAIPSTPMTGRSILDPQIGVVWNRKEEDVYWVAANLEERLWLNIFDFTL